MLRIRRILVPIDFSETSRAALDYGVEMTRAFDAELHLLNVDEHPGEAAEAECPAGLLEDTRNAVYDRLGMLLTDEQSSVVDLEFAIRIGTPSDEIVRYSVEQAIDLVVMGTHGRTGIARVVMGSVAEKVVRMATCPVLTIHNPEREVITPEQARVLAWTPT